MYQLLSTFGHFLDSHYVLGGLILFTPLMIANFLFSQYWLAPRVSNWIKTGDFSRSKKVKSYE